MGTLVGPNDFTDDGAGGVWMTTSGPWASEPIAGAVYHIAPDLSMRQLADDLHYANGIARKGTALFVADPKLHGSSCLTSATTER